MPIHSKNISMSAHDHDCAHDHDHDGDFSVEQGISGLVLAFAELTFAQIDFDAFSSSAAQRRLGLLYLLGAVQSLCGLEELGEEEIETVFSTVISELFPWDDKEVADAVRSALAAVDSEDAEEALARGREAIEATLGATFSLADLLGGDEE